MESSAPPIKATAGLAAMAAAGELLAQPRDVECFDLPCRTILNKVDSPRVPFDFSINPYRGCEFGCTYCYARYTHEYLELGTDRDFERKIYAKRGAARALARDLARVRKPGWIAIGTATDPYQPVERRLELTRSMLEELARHSGLRLSVTTKSDLVLRDLDLLGEIARRSTVHVNVTITTLDAELARSLEPRAPTPEKRLGAVERLAAAGIPTVVLCAPILPWITDKREDLRALFGAAKRAGARDVRTQVLFLRSCSRPTFYAWLASVRPRLVERYRQAYERSDYAPRLTRAIQDLARLLLRELGFEGVDDEDPPAPAGADAPRQLPLFGVA